MAYPDDQPGTTYDDHDDFRAEVQRIADGAGYKVIAKTTTYTMLAGEFVKADTSGGAWTLTLPAASSKTRVGVVKSSSDSNALTITPASGTINGDASATITEQYAGCYLHTDGTDWFVVGVF